MTMPAFLIYEGKVAVALLVFYLFYRFLLKKETFHRFNRVMLVGTALLSFLLPFCIVTFHRPMEPAAFAGPVNLGGMVPAGGEAISGGLPAAVAPWWTVALEVLFFIGVAFVLIRLAVSILSIVRIVRQGECVREEDGCRIIVTEREIDPFSWMRYIVLSREDWEGPHATMLTHEKAHIAYGHSTERLLVDILSAFQWFNPAIWMLRADLQELHEYEADDAVLRSGANLKEYQLLLIRKAVSKSGYSVANSFNHSILKNRITMMSKSKSPLMRGLRALYLLPLVCLGIGLQARTVYVSNDKVNQNDEKTRIILRQKWGEEKVITQEEFKQLDQERIASIDFTNGVVLVTLKLPQELPTIVVVRTAEEEKEVPFYLIEPETLPKFQGGDMDLFSRWLNSRIYVPKGCKHSGTMKVGFVVAEDGSVKDVRIMESVCEELDTLMLNLVAQSPKWEPATSGGHPVAQFLTVPVDFIIR